jgi:subtilisin family serine protease
MRDDGVVPESCLINTLTLLLARHVEAMANQDPTGIVDVLSLSLGYYHESPSDTLMDGPLGALLADYGRYGVAVIAAAGNATTLAPMYPAGFAAQTTGFSPDRVPLASVGALNPDGSTVAYYSNAGTWVSTHRPGSSLVSTFPTDAGASAQASARVDFAGRTRSTQDPDDFRSGFCTWSGTSFAAPVLAGQVAAALVEDPSLPDMSIRAAVARGRAAMLGQVAEWAGMP